MKTSKTSKIALTIALPVVITVLASLLFTRSNATAANSDGQHLEGSWIVTAHVTDNPDLLIKALLTCTPNGEVIETPSVPLAVSTGHGVWTRTGNREFSLTVLYLRLEAGELVGTSKVRSVFKVNEAKTQGSGRFETTVFDLDGHQVGSFEGMAEASRIQAEPLE